MVSAPGRGSLRPAGDPATRAGLGTAGRTHASHSSWGCRGGSGTCLCLAEEQPFKGVAVGGSHWACQL